MILLAHRGCWRERAEQNALEAFHAAFSAGYGIETDIRDLDGDLVISHDPPRRGALRFEAVLELHRRLAPGAWLALNIKADGLADGVLELVTRFGVANAFVFDMAVPDARSYLARAFPTFTRHSEIEQVPAFYNAAAGIWLDAFDEPWVAPDQIRTHLEAGKFTAVVSPELHRKPHLLAWEAWKSELERNIPAGLAGERLMLCTDFPDEAREFFHVGI